jgi:ribosomal protein L40E
MTEEKTTGQSNDTLVAAHADPALIPTAIYEAEGKMTQLGPSLFTSSEMLDKMLSMATKKDLVTAMDALFVLVHQIRSEVMAQTGRRSQAVGKGFRNYGFLMASNQSMNNFPELAPNFVSIDAFNDVTEDYLFTRDVTERMTAITNDMRDIMNIFGNLGFDFALAYYSNVRSIADRTRDKTAISVFEILRRFFSRKRTPLSSDQPTEAQLERDFHALLHGHTDGEMVVEGKAAHTTASQHGVIDETFKPHGAFKEKIQGTVCPQCGAENESHARFCIHCGKQL